ncbi:AI-2E family transporter [Methylococcus sp. EFPC2]|uniref:AI-2E family transporter n=1 Tax=Methylococcus sp. EFPC2 TaxID=2812648 RepID=UPI001967AF53|nr:AI-2E family transporter [Methylococcus sp. EFPC2]QSA98687.1 AI-2E family transporter [Methylococcus sp. EFPC2]
MEAITRYFAPGLLLGGLLALAYLVLQHFLVPVGWATILVYSSWPLFLRVERLLGNKTSWAALAMTLGLAATIIVPLIWISALSQKEVAAFFRNLPLWLEQKPEVPPFVSRIPYLGPELLNLFDQSDDLRGLLKERVAPWLRQFSGEILSIVSDVGVIAAQLGLTLLTTFFLYRDGRHAVGQIRQVLTQAVGERLKDYFGAAQATTKAVVYGIVLTALAQGALAGLGYWATGIGAPVLLSILTMFFALIPFGTPLVWVSASIWLLANGQHWAGISLALWGSLVVSWVDNIVRPLVISGATRIPFLLVFFGVLGGLARFGLIGLFLGPVILALSLTVWREWLGKRASS